MKRKKLIVIPNAGLGNRMRVIASCVQIAKKENRELVMVWPKNAALNCDITDIFETIGLNYSTPSRLKSFFLSNIYRHGAVQKFSNIYKSVANVFSINSVFDADTIEGNMPKLNPEDNTLIVATCFAFGTGQDYHSFKFDKNLREKTETEYKKIGDNYIGVHIRRTDHADLIKHSPFENYLAQMDKCIKENPSQKFFLATDNEETKTLLTQRYGERVYTFQHNVSRNNIEGVHGAIVELLLLSKSQKIICSTMSSFSDTAILLGNVEDVINV